MVFQDGHAYVSEAGDLRVPVVFDNLIHQGAMPVTIGIFLNPGLFTDKIEGRQGWKAPEGVKRNRSVEYDSLDADYVTFLEKEILHEVSKDHNLSEDPSMRAICGMSSGGICAFTAAWQRPDLFRKVVSPHREFYQYPRRPCLSGLDPKGGEKAVACVPAGWFQRFG